MSSSHHPVTEFACLQLTPPTTLQHPQLILGLLAGTKAQHAWSGYPPNLFIHQFREEPSASKDFSDKTSTSIYIISGWASVEAHNEWIASPKNQEIMRSFGNSNLLRLGGLAHLDIDFTKLSFEECSHILWRKRSVSDTLSWEDTTGRNVGNDNSESGSERKVKGRVIWSYRGRPVDESVEDEYELVGFSEGGLPESERLNVDIRIQFIFIHDGVVSRPVVRS
ncbi:hypothetical protein AGABI1DRAFT_124830 [Agaricus bisporus var. burnettii JB137-S8]|uniref:Uncharacterized protein n=1 Tax=Agaricus bisporus var. burnettii (strain JB137-S8 / ATCC MYA-4627 / FGSC 10392) TaxID=597362 RepID=K5XG02_AGABU|nr:uncharacterized protein AGABI1DRAFT_124830 [Agaricus bisporus var. burnettii JB137-S8]EKM82353.1 hypothetical protein AGABI1DRAFT_124830 [Agaricus bisporus var. burnettii JB137-S8]